MSSPQSQLGHESHVDDDIERMKNERDALLLNAKGIQSELIKLETTFRTDTFDALSMTSPAQMARLISNFELNADKACAALEDVGDELEKVDDGIYMSPGAIDTFNFDDVSDVMQKEIHGKIEAAAKKMNEIFVKATAQYKRIVDQIAAVSEANDSTKITTTHEAGDTQPNSDLHVTLVPVLQRKNAQLKKDLELAESRARSIAVQRAADKRIHEEQMLVCEKKIAQLTQKLHLAESKKRFREQTNRDESNAVGVVSAIEFDELKSEMENLKGVISRQEEDVTLKAQSILQLTADLSAARYDLQGFERSKQKLEQKIDDLLKKETHFSERLQDMREECSKSMKLREDSLQEEMAELRAKTHEYNAYLNSKSKMEAYVSRLETEEKKHIELLEVQNKRLLELEKVSRERDDQVKAYSRDMLLLSKQLIEKDTTIDLLKNALLASSQCIDAMNTKITDFSVVSQRIDAYSRRLAVAEHAMTRSELRNALVITNTDGSDGVSLVVNAPPIIENVAESNVEQDDESYRGGSGSIDINEVETLHSELQEQFISSQRDFEVQLHERDAVIAALQQQLQNASQSSMPREEISSIAEVEMSCATLAATTQTDIIAKTTATSQTDIVDEFHTESLPILADAAVNAILLTHADIPEPQITAMDRNFTFMQPWLDANIPGIIEEVVDCGKNDNTEQLILKLDHVISSKLLLVPDELKVSSADMKYLHDVVMWSLSQFVPLMKKSADLVTINDTTRDVVDTLIIREIQHSDSAFTDVKICNAGCQTDPVETTTAKQSTKQRKSLTNNDAPTSAEANRRASGQLTRRKPSSSHKEKSAKGLKRRKPSKALKAAGNAYHAEATEAERIAPLPVDDSLIQSSQSECESSSDESYVSEVPDAVPCIAASDNVDKEDADVLEHFEAEIASICEDASANAVDAVVERLLVASVATVAEDVARDQMSLECMQWKQQVFHLKQELIKTKDLTEHAQKEIAALQVQIKENIRSNVINIVEVGSAAALATGVSSGEEIQSPVVDVSRASSDCSIAYAVSQEPPVTKEAADHVHVMSSPRGFDASKYLTVATAESSANHSSLPTTSQRRPSRLKAIELFQKTQPTIIAEDVSTRGLRSRESSPFMSYAEGNEHVDKTPALHDLSSFSDRSADVSMKNSANVPFSELAFARAHIRDKFNQGADLGIVKSEQFDVLRGGMYGSDAIVELTRLIFYSRSIAEDETHKPAHFAKALKPIGGSHMQRRSPVMPSRKATTMALNLEVSNLSHNIASTHTIDQLAKYLHATERKLLMIRSMSIWKSIKHSIDNDMFQDILQVHRDNIQKCIASAGGWATAFEFAKGIQNYSAADTSYWPDFFRVKVLEHYREAIGSKLNKCEAEIASVHEANLRLRSELEDERKGMAEERSWAFKEISVLSKQIASLLLSKTETAPRPSTTINTVKSISDEVEIVNPSEEKSIIRLNSSQNPYYIQSSALKSSLAVQNVIQNVETEKKLLQTTSESIPESNDVILQQQQRRIDDVAFAVYRKKPEAIKFATQLTAALKSWKRNDITVAKQQLEVCHLLSSAESEAKMVECFCNLLLMPIEGMTDILEVFYATLDESLQHTQSPSTTPAVLSTVLSTPFVHDVTSASQPIEVTEPTKKSSVLSLIHNETIDTSNVVERRSFCDGCVSGDDSKSEYSLKVAHESDVIRFTPISSPKATTVREVTESRSALKPAVSTIVVPAPLYPGNMSDSSSIFTPFSSPKVTAVYDVPENKQELTSAASTIVVPTPPIVCDRDIQATASTATVPSQQPSGRRVYQRLTSNDDILDEIGMRDTYLAKMTNTDKAGFTDASIDNNKHAVHATQTSPVTNDHGVCVHCGHRVSSTSIVRNNNTSILSASAPENLEDLQNQHEYILRDNTDVPDQYSNQLKDVAVDDVAEELIKDVLNPLREQISTSNASCIEPHDVIAEAQQPRNATSAIVTTLAAQRKHIPRTESSSTVVPPTISQPYHHMAKQFSLQLTNRDGVDKSCQTDSDSDVLITQPQLLRQPSVVTASSILRIASPRSQKVAKSLHEMRVLLVRHINPLQLHNAAILDNEQSDFSMYDIEICRGIVLLCDFEDLLWTGKESKQEDVDDDDEDEGVEVDRFRNAVEMRRRRYLPPGVTLARRIGDAELAIGVTEWHGWSDMPFPKPSLPRDIVAVQLPPSLHITPDIELISHLGLGEAFELPSDIWAVRIKHTRQIVDDETLPDIEDAVFHNMLPPALRPVELVEMVRVSKSLSLKLSPLVKFVEMSSNTSFLNIPSWCSANLPNGFEFAKGIIHTPICYVASLNAQPQLLPFSLPARIFPVKIMPRAVLPTFLRPLLLEGEIEVLESTDDDEMYKECITAGITVVPTPASIELPSGMILIRRKYSPLSNTPHALPPGMRLVPPSAHPPRLKLTTDIELVQLTPRFELPAGVKLSAAAEVIHRPVGVRLRPNQILVARTPGSVLPRGCVLGVLPDTSKGVFLPSGVDLLEYPAGLRIPFGAELSPGIIVVDVAGVSDKLPIGVYLVKRDPAVDLAIPGFERGFKNDLPHGSRLPAGVEVLRLRPRYEVPCGVLLAHNTVLGRDIQLPVGVEIVPGVEVVEWPQGMFLPQKMELVKLKENSFLPKYIHVVSEAELVNSSSKYIDNRCPIGCMVIYLPDNLHLPSSVQLAANIEVVSVDFSLPEGMLPVKRLDSALPFPAEIICTAQNIVPKSQIPMGIELVKIAPRYHLPPGTEVCRGVLVCDEPYANMLPDDLLIASVEGDCDLPIGVERYSIDVKLTLKERQEVLYLKKDTIHKVHSWGAELFYIRPVMLGGVVIPPYCYFVEELDSTTPLSQHFELIPRESVSDYIPASDAGMFNLPVNVSLIRLKPIYCLPIGISVSNDLRLLYGCRFSPCEPLGGGFEVAMESVTFDIACLATHMPAANVELPNYCVLAPASTRFATASSFRALLCDKPLPTFKERLLSNHRHVLDIERREKELAEANRFTDQREKLTLLITDSSTASMYATAKDSSVKSGEKVSLIAYKSLQAKNERMLTEVSQLETQNRYLRRSAESQAKELSYASAKHEKSLRLCDDMHVKWRDAQSELLQIRANVKKAEATLQLRIDDLGFQVRNLEYSNQEKEDKIEALTGKLAYFERNGDGSSDDLQKQKSKIHQDKIAACKYVLAQYHKVIVAMADAACSLTMNIRGFTLDKLATLRKQHGAKEEGSLSEEFEITQSIMDDETVHSQNTRQQRRYSGVSMSSSVSSLPKLKHKRQPESLVQQKELLQSKRSLLPSIKTKSSPTYIIGSVEYKKRQLPNSINFQAADSVLMDSSILQSQHSSIEMLPLMKTEDYLSMLTNAISEDWETDVMIRVDTATLQDAVKAWLNQAMSTFSEQFLSLNLLYGNALNLMEREAEANINQLMDLRAALRYAENRIEEIKSISSDAALGGVRISELEQALLTANREHHSMRLMSSHPLTEVLRSKVSEVNDLAEQEQRLQLGLMIIRKTIKSQNPNDITYTENERKAIRHFVTSIKKKESCIKQRIDVLKQRKSVEIDILRREVEAVEGIVQDVIPPKLLSQILECGAIHSQRATTLRNI